MYDVMYNIVIHLEAGVGHEYPTVCAGGESRQHGASGVGVGAGTEQGRSRQTVRTCMTNIDRNAEVTGISSITCLNIHALIRA